MQSIDYLNALGVGSAFNTTEIVTALVDAERAPEQSRLDNKIEESNAEISALGLVKASIVDLQAAAQSLKDADDFDSFTTLNTQPTAFSMEAGAGAVEGAHTISISSVAKGQSTNLSQNGDSVFSSSSQILNSGTAFDLSIQIGGGSGTTHTITVSNPTPTGIADAITAADIGITANLLDTGTSGTSYIVQLTGQTGTANAFTVSEPASSVLSSNTPSGFAATDASLTINGLAFTRSSNTISDILPGITIGVNSTTSSAASTSLTRDTSVVEAKILDFVDAYNSTREELANLTSSSLGGELRGDTIIRSLIRDIRNVVINDSSTPGTDLVRLSDAGIAITRTGSLAIDQTKLDSALSSNFNDLTTIFSANTTDQTESGVASRGIAGDLSKLVTDLTSTDGYIATRTSSLNNAIEGYDEDLLDLEARMESVQARYEQQFLAMQNIIEEMNNTKDNLISTFDNLPFTNND